MATEDPFFKAQEIEAIQRRGSSHQVSSVLMGGDFINISHRRENTKKGHVNNLCSHEEHIHL